MKNNLYIFCLETTKGSNLKDKKSDEVYIKN